MLAWFPLSPLRAWAIVPRGIVSHGNAFSAHFVAPAGDFDARRHQLLWAPRSANRHRRLAHRRAPGGIAGHPRRTAGHQRRQFARESLDRFAPAGSRTVTRSITSRRSLAARLPAVALPGTPSPAPRHSMFVASKLVAGRRHPGQNHLATGAGLLHRVVAKHQQLTAGGITGAIGQRDFVARRSRPAAWRRAPAPDRGRRRSTSTRGEIDVDVGRQIMGRIANLVEQLLDDGFPAHPAAGSAPAW